MVSPFYDNMTNIFGLKVKIKLFAINQQYVEFLRGEDVCFVGGQFITYTQSRIVIYIFAQPITNLKYIFSKYGLVISPFMVTKRKFR